MMAAIRKMRENGVAARMSVGVVDELEIIKVDIKESEQLGIQVGPLNSLAK